MKCFVSFVCALSVLVVVVSAAPFYPAGGIGGSATLQVGLGSPTSSGGTSSTSTSSSGSGGGNAITNVLSNIDLPGLLRGVNSFVRLVGQFCPPLSQVLDNVIQNVTSTAFRIFGRIILQNGGLGGGGGSGSSSGGGQTVNVVLPTFPPDEDEEYDDEEETSSTNLSSSASTAATTAAVTTTNDAAETINSLSPASSEDSNNVAKRHIRVPRAAEEEAEAEEDTDQDGAESAPEPAQDLANAEDDQDRNKRFLPFGGSVSGHGGGGGGSGNFLFDVIRLVAGSGATEESDEKANAPGGVAEVDVVKTADGYTEGIPGPITRLFVIANRGIANLVQDLILRLAQTSERLVNFKARLVTSLI